MDTDLLVHKFEKIGARVQVGPVVRRRFGNDRGPLQLDIGKDHRGEFFDLKIDEQRIAAMDAVDVRPRERHLLLLAWMRPAAARDGVPRWSGSATRASRWVETVVPSTQGKPRFLCGHDERHWFVAAIPEAAHASNVRTAMEALKPEAVLRAQAQGGIRFEDRFRRRNRAFRRQGEWFFLPVPDLVVPKPAVRSHEPMQRSGGKAHWAEWAYRRGGQVVYVSDQYPSGLTEDKYRAVLAERPELRVRFRTMLRDATLFVRGRISHPDHAMIVLQEWHEVVMNTEHQAAARRNVVFLD